ncbi:MAG TPA: hypothetical protein DHU80_04725 [Cryomorphaceae bacterium]|nr:hypothetical protein [Cryomorphaceae bacterium]
MLSYYIKPKRIASSSEEVFLIFNMNQKIKIMKRNVFLLLFSICALSVSAQQKDLQYPLGDFRLSVNASFMGRYMGQSTPGTTTSIGGSIYVSYKKLLIGHTVISGGPISQEYVMDDRYDISQEYDMDLNIGSIGYEVSKDLFLKAGFGVYNQRGETTASNRADCVFPLFVKYNVSMLTPSFGVLYMNRPYHYTIGLDIAAPTRLRVPSPTRLAPLMLLSLGFNL